MNGINVKYDDVIELMEYVGPRYNYGNWIRLVQYMPSTRRYVVSTNYIELEETNKKKGETIFTYEG